MPALRLAFIPDRSARFNLSDDNLVGRGGHGAMPQHDRSGRHGGAPVMAATVVSRENNPWLGGRDDGAIHGGPATYPDEVTLERNEDLQRQSKARDDGHHAHARRRQASGATREPLITMPGGPCCRQDRRPRPVAAALQKAMGPTVIEMPAKMRRRFSEYGRGDTGRAASHWAVDPAKWLNRAATDSGAAPNSPEGCPISSYAESRDSRRDGRAAQSVQWKLMSSRRILFVLRVFRALRG